MGLASDKAQYIHRLGRTARAGKSGKGMLLLGDFEDRFLGSLQELPLARAAPLPGSALAEAGALVQRGLMQVDDEDKAQVTELKAVSLILETHHTTRATCMVSARPAASGHPSCSVSIMPKNMLPGRWCSAQHAFVSQHLIL